MIWFYIETKPTPTSNKLISESIISICLPTRHIAPCRGKILETRNFFVYFVKVLPNLNFHFDHKICHSLEEEKIMNALFGIY